MDRIPSIALIAIMLVLIIGVAVGGFFKLIKPAQAELSSVQAKLQQKQDTADKLESAKEELIKVTGRWLGADTKLQKLMDRRSIKLSFGQPLPALFASLWPEMRQNLARTVEEWVTDQGVKITSGDSIAAPWAYKGRCPTLRNYIERCLSSPALLRLRACHYQAKVIQ